MNAALGWALALAALAVGWTTGGSQGVVLAVSVIAFWLLLQFSRTMRVLRAAAARPVGHVDSAVMLHARLRPGMTLIDVLRITGSLGHKRSDAPETFAWTDPGDARVVLELQNGRCLRWTLERPESPSPSAP